jgi:aminopeptidase N
MRTPAPRTSPPPSGARRGRPRAFASLVIAAAALIISAACVVPSAQAATTATTFVDTTATWRYVDSGTAPASTWATVGYKDTAWKSGAAQLGAGDGDERTKISRLSPAHRIDWFRRTFTVADATKVTSLSLGLVAPDGRDMPLQLADESLPGAGSRTFVISQASETLTFIGVDAEPVPSLLRGFSAPVVLQHDYTDAQLLHLLAHDSDPFNRWEAGQRLAMRAALKALADGTSVGVLDAPFLDAMRGVLRHPQLDAAFKELVLSLPSQTYIAEQLAVVDPQQVHAVREAMRLQLASALREDWQWAFEAHKDNGAYRPDPVSTGRRALSGMALAMLCLDAVQTAGSGSEVWPGKTYQRFKTAGNMTDRFNALSALVACGHPLADEALARFHAMFKDEALVLDKWFALQAGAPDRGGNVLPQVRQLLKHPDFNIRNPNRARSVIFSYCSGNPGAFHRADAAGYVFWSERVLELDAINPQVAARLARALDRWSRLAEPYRSAAREAIARVAAKTDLSNDVREVVSRALSD